MVLRSEIERELKLSTKANESYHYGSIAVFELDSIKRYEMQYIQVQIISV